MPRCLTSLFTYCVSAALLSACARHQPAVTFPVSLAGRTFHLEVAADPTSIERGLGGRAMVPTDGGMLFIFNEAEYRGFVMSDCQMPLDLLFLDEQAKIITLHSMTPEPPRGLHESAHIPDQNARYLARLKIYPSKEPCRYAIELAGGTLQLLELREGDSVLLDFSALSKLLSER